MSDRHPHVINADDLPWGDGPGHGSRFGYQGKRLGAAAGGRQLGCSMFLVQPGRRAFPFHAHLVNEEALFILDGTGSLRLGDHTVAVRAGDYVALPAGTDGAHQLVNDGDAPLRYLCVSTMTSPEVALYPDSDKLGVMGGQPTPIRVLVRRDAATAGYFDGEQPDD